MGLSGVLKGKTGTDADLQLPVRDQPEDFVGAPPPLLGVEQEVVDSWTGDGQRALCVELLEVKGRHLPRRAAEVEAATFFMTTP